MNSWIAALTLAMVLATGCASKAYQVHPGSGGYISGTPTGTQLFISQSYDSLSAADAVIQQTRADILASKFPVSAAAAIKTAFNASVTAYDAAQQAWVAFNTASTGGATPSQSALAAALATMNSAISNLTSAKQGN